MLAPPAGLLPAWLRPALLGLVIILLGIWSLSDLLATSLEDPQVVPDDTVLVLPYIQPGVQRPLQVSWVASFDGDRLSATFSIEYWMKATEVAPVFLVTSQPIAGALESCPSVDSVEALPEALTEVSERWTFPYATSMLKIQPPPPVSRAWTCEMFDGFSTARSRSDLLVEVPRIEIAWDENTVRQPEPKVIAGAVLPVDWAPTYQRSGEGEPYTVPVSDNRSGQLLWIADSVTWSGNAMDTLEADDVGPIVIHATKPSEQSRVNAALFRAGVLAGVTGGALLLLYEWLPWRGNSRRMR